MSLIYVTSAINRGALYYEIEDRSTREALIKSWIHTLILASTIFSNSPHNSVFYYYGHISNQEVLQVSRIKIFSWA